MIRKKQKDRMTTDEYNISSTEFSSEKMSMKERNRVHRNASICNKSYVRRRRRKMNSNSIVRTMIIAIALLSAWIGSNCGVWGEVDLQLGDLNVLVVTDVHSWVAGHLPHESMWDVDYGHLLSFYQRLKEECDSQKKDLFFVMNGDFMDGTGLSRHPPKDLISILRHMPWDAINVGNHELYEDSTIEFLTDPKDGMLPTLVLIEDDATSQKTINNDDKVVFNNDTMDDILNKNPNSTEDSSNSSPLAPRSSLPIKNWKDTYITSNVRLAANNETMGNRYRFLYAPHADTYILTFGFLYNMKGNSPLTIVDTVEEVVQSDWFIHVLSSNVADIDEHDDRKHFDAILVLAHMHVIDPLVEVISSAIRDICGPFMPVQFVTGHTHMRRYQIIDHFSSSFEAGRYLDTVGFLSFPTNQTVTKAIERELSTNANFTKEFLSQPSSPFPPKPLDDNNSTLEDNPTLVNNMTNSTIKYPNCNIKCTMANNTNTTNSIIDNDTNNANTTDLIIDNDTNTTSPNSTDIIHTNTFPVNSTQNLNLGNLTNTFESNKTDDNTTDSTPNHSIIPTMSPNILSPRSFIKFNLTTDLFKHEFIEANISTLTRKLNIPSIDTPDGKALTKLINETQYKLGLKRILGCAPITYHVNKDTSQTDSLWRLYRDEVINNGFLKGDSSKIFIQSAGSLRYNIFSGPNSVTDLISASPFNDTIWSIAKGVKGSDFLEAVTILNEDDRNHFHSEIPHYVVAPVIHTIQSNNYYDIFTAEYDKNYVQKGIFKVTNSTILKPILYDNGKVTTSTLWDTFLNTSWPCPVEIKTKPGIPTFFKSVQMFFEELTWWKALAMAITMVLFFCFACFFLGPIELCDDKYSKHNGSDDSMSSSETSSRYYDEIHNYDSCSRGISLVRSDDMQSIGTIKSFA